MSLDYPFYQELRRRKHPGAKWWIIGDRLYYLGLLPTMLAVPAAVVGLAALMMGVEWGARCFALSLLVGAIGSTTTMIGTWFKRRAYRLAERDGISAAEVYNRSAENNGPV